MTQNARHQRARIFNAFSRVCPKSVGSHREITRFSVEFHEGDGLTNRCMFERKSWIPQVLTFTYT